MDTLEQECSKNVRDSRRVHMGRGMEGGRATLVSSTRGPEMSQGVSGLGQHLCFQSMFPGVTVSE
jgi:hypothetical protein